VQDMRDGFLTNGPNLRVATAPLPNLRGWGGVRGLLEEPGRSWEAAMKDCSRRGIAGNVGAQLFSDTLAWHQRELQAASEMATQKQVADTAAAAAEQAYQRTLQAAAPRWRRSKNDGAQVFANALGFDSRVLEWQNEYDQWTEYDPAVAQLALTNLWKGVMQTQFKAGNKQDYTLDLSTMQQTNHKHGTARALRWVQTQSSGGSHRDHYPDYWDLSHLPSDPTQFATVKLSPLSQTFKDAEQLFKSTAPSSLGIVSIEAIQHSLRWKAFQFKRDMIETALHARGGARESKCFHGTSHANVDQISACSVEA
jgi:hypothetical protein